MLVKLAGVASQKHTFAKSPCAASSPAELVFSLSSRSRRARVCLLTLCSERHLCSEALCRGPWNGGEEGRASSARSAK